MIKTTMLIPRGLWQEAKKAAVDLQVSAQQFVIDLLSERLAQTPGKGGKRSKAA